MCGIAGVVRVNGSTAIDRDAVRRMTVLLAHRGPDGDGFHFEDGIGFGHRRLSIIDLEGGAQPLFNENETVVVVFNGEIYDFAELADELMTLGHSFRTRCDTEVIVHAWEQWGSECLSKLNGMFAFAIWDRNRRTIFLARDRLGIKPLYYSLLDTGELLFASELKSLLAYTHKSPQIDARAIEDYFTFGYVPDPKSIYCNIHKLEPGCYLELKIHSKQAVPQRYWDVPLYGPMESRRPDDEQHLIEGLRQSVARHLVADVPLGAFLSGGIDSSAIVAMMRDIGTSRLLTCTMGFREDEYDESNFARLVADQKCTEHKFEVVDFEDYDLIDRLVDIYDEPYADSSAIPTYRVCELARKHVKVALSGDGGDENFIGYRRYRLFSAEEALRQRLPLGFRRGIFGFLGRHYPKLDWAPRFLRGKTTFQALAMSTAEAYRHAVSVCSDEIRRELFSTNFRSELRGYTSASVFEDYLQGKEFQDPLRLVQYLDFKTYLPGDILTKVDRASMHHGLEVRVPFLDFRFVEQVAKLPTRAKLKRGEGKYILKKALEPFLPREVLYRTKMGFAVPLAAWFREPLKKRIAETIGGEVLCDSGYFDPQTLQRLLEEHDSGRRDHASILWSLLMFEAFLRKARA